MWAWKVSGRVGSRPDTVRESDTGGCSLRWRNSFCNPVEGGSEGRCVELTPPPAEVRLPLEGMTRVRSGEWV